MYTVKDMKLSIKYREEVEEFITKFIDLCEKCENTSEMINAASELLIQLKQYIQKH